MNRPHVLHGDARDELGRLPDASVDSIVTDPPYELGFMGKGWDSSGVAYDVDLWGECLRVLKPGGHLLAFGGTRTYHRMTVAIEDAGFEIRDSIHWIYGSGFPKSLDVSKAIDAKITTGGSAPTNLRRRDMGHGYTPSPLAGTPGYGDGSISTAADGGNGRERGDALPLVTEAARTWQGWGTALKPAHEPIVVARKPLAGTVAANVLAHGTGAINVDGCRVEGSESTRRQNKAEMGYHGGNLAASYATGSDAGRWPANIVLTHDEDCADACAEGCPVAEMGEPGRFFPVFRYQAKAPTAERPVGPDGTKHATVKPLALMRWLVRLVTPPGGIVLDPFAGSGTTIEAAILEGFTAVGVEFEAAHLPLIQQRIDRSMPEAA